jgi:hypothetical protein
MATAGAGLLTDPGHNAALNSGALSCGWRPMPGAVRDPSRKPNGMKLPYGVLGAGSSSCCAGTGAVPRVVTMAAVKSMVRKVQFSNVYASGAWTTSQYQAWPVQGVLEVPL